VIVWADCTRNSDGDRATSGEAKTIAQNNANVEPMRIWVMVWMVSRR
jgi:hypothetical protein